MNYFSTTPQGNQLVLSMARTYRDSIMVRVRVQRLIGFQTVEIGSDVEITLAPRPLPIDTVLYYVMGAINNCDDALRDKERNYSEA